MIIISAPSDAPDIVETEFMPPSTIRITWNTLFFSNGDITNYTVQFVDMFNDSLTVYGNNASHSRDMFVSTPFVNVTVRASNQYGDGPRSVTIVSTSGMFICTYYMSSVIDILENIVMINLMGTLAI